MVSAKTTVFPKVTVKKLAKMALLWQTHRKFVISGFDLAEIDT